MPDFSLHDWLHQPEKDAVQSLLTALDWDAAQGQRVTQAAAKRIETIRAAGTKTGSLESFFRQYKLDTAEGLALMSLAEALLRIPDSKTADALLKDKMAQGDWLDTMAGTSDIATKAAGIGLALGRGTLSGVLGRLGAPVVRQAASQAMKILGKQFVLGQDIEDALKNARGYEKRGYRLSYDMLGEGARTAGDAQRYFDDYAQAIKAIGRSGQKGGISVKLSALHPRYRYAQQDRCVPALTNQLLQLCQLAKAHDITLTVDAEEAARLEISLDIILTAARDASLKGWQGLGLAVQAYQKRALPLINHLINIAENSDRQLRIRLVKGAYWDSEIKWAQMEGLADYPVFTRKINTDLSYLACAQKLLQARGQVWPLFGTHNAATVAAIEDMAGDKSGYGFQKLYGMGDALYDRMVEEGHGVDIYAPVGKHSDLLPYLVRRLLENGANSSFVNQIYDEAIPPSALAEDVVAAAKSAEPKQHPAIPLPADIFKPARTNSAGIDLNDDGSVQALSAAMVLQKNIEGGPLLGGKLVKTGRQDIIRNPADTAEVVGSVWQSDEDTVRKAFACAQKGFADWSAMSASARSNILRKAARLLEEKRSRLMGLCVTEAGKTIPDALAEVREAVDFLRYYAQQGDVVFDEKGIAMPGYTGEENHLILTPRGIFVCISPWNFPLAIFTGQVAAALMAGNAVIAKPAEQTPLIACEMVKILHAAGVPPEALSLVTGDGRIGAMIVQQTGVAGVAFTGSVEAAHAINRALAEKDGPIVPLIAETGGQNAIIADSSALTEQLVDDVLLSAFGSAGQRCSAARILFIQDDVADKTITMLQGAMAELRVGDPAKISTDIGPLIDEEALATLKSHRARINGFGKILAEAPLDSDIARQGHFFAPVLAEIPGLDVLTKEVFGPALHLVRYSASRVDDVFAAINATGYGLTFGVHSRIDSFKEKAARSVRAGNIYINRSTIGAIVGVQPFGGQGLSGTGFKAGGPHYLLRFATEKHISDNITAAGGNASLVMLGKGR